MQFAMMQTFEYRKMVDQQRAMVTQALGLGLEIGSEEHLKLLVEQQKEAARGVLEAMSRIFCNNLSPDGTDVHLVRKLFGPFGPIRGVELPPDPLTGKTGVAIITFEHAESAELAIVHMNLQRVDGRQIKVGRQVNLPVLMPPFTALCEDEKNRTRVFVSSIHPKLSEAEMTHVFEAFGRLKLCRLAPDVLAAAEHRGYGFVEYMEEEDAALAIETMNFMELGSQWLRVRRAITPLDLCAWLKLSVVKIPPAEPEEATPLVEEAKPTPEEAVESEKTISGRNQRLLMMKKLAKKRTTVMVLDNMVGPDGVDDELEPDVRGECEAIGPVHKVRIHTTADGSAVRVFVNFEDYESVVPAIDKMHGRWFDGRQIRASEVKMDDWDEERFEEPA